MNGDIKKFDWTKRWAGSYTFISCSYWGRQYCDSLKEFLGISFNHTLFIHRKGTVSFYIPQKELDRFGKRLSRQVIEDNRIVRVWGRELKNNTDKIIKIMKKIGNTIPRDSDYTKFVAYFYKHLAFHNAIKKTVDYLPQEVLTKLLSVFSDARLYSEKVYSKTETFFRSVMKIIGRKEIYNAEYLTCLTQKEFEHYLSSGELPKEKILQKRFELSGLYVENGKEHTLDRKMCISLEKNIIHASSQAEKIIRGISAYPGRVRGIARVIADPHGRRIFNIGDILVTGMTRPEFLLFMKKSSAIVTDAGGILCHAAISAREMKKPCIVGTQNATELLKNGDLVEVDAERGIIRKINS